VGHRYRCALRHCLRWPHDSLQGAQSQIAPIVSGCTCRRQRLDGVANHPAFL